MHDSIAENYYLCLDAFIQLLEALEKSGNTFKDTLPASILQNECGRFKVWAGNIGAHQIGKISLDYRLRDASYLKEQVIAFLTDLEESLREAKSIVSGLRKPAEEIDHEVISDSDSDTSNASAAGFSETDQILKGIKDCINCLYKLSITIRQPAPHDRLVKAQKIPISHFEEFDLQHAKAKFPNANEELTSRLAKANTRRRQQFKYREQHHSSIAKDIEKPKRGVPLGLSSELPVHSEILPDMVTKTKSSAGTEWAQIDTVPEPTVVASTKASTLVLPQKRLDIDVQSDSGLTQTSYASTSFEGSKLAIPPRPEASLNEAPFECLFCYTICKVRSDRAWKRHVFKDTQPYQCTFGGCTLSEKLFDSSTEWMNHEFEIHRLEWVCNVEGYLARSKKDFVRHLRDDHTETANDAQIATLVEVCSRPSSAEHFVCPLCGRGNIHRNKLQGHLGRHLEELSLFSLPRNHTGDEDVKGSRSAFIESRSSISAKDDASSSGPAPVLETDRSAEPSGSKPVSWEFSPGELIDPYTHLPDWAEYWGLGKAELESKPRKEVDRQFAIREIITTEYNYHNQLTVLSSLYRDALISSTPPIIPSPRLHSFINTVFGNLDDIQQLSTELLEHLHTLQEEQGPWISDISRPFQDCAWRARSAYTLYASRFPKAQQALLEEANQNPSFAQFLDQVQKNKYSHRLGWYSYLSCPTWRIKTYPILLQTISKKTSQPEEAAILSDVIAQLKQIELECNLALEREEVAIKESSKPDSKDDKPHGIEANVRADQLPANPNPSRWSASPQFIAASFSDLFSLASTLRDSIFESSRHPILDGGSLNSLLDELNTLALLSSSFRDALWRLNLPEASSKRDHTISHQIMENLTSILSLCRKTLKDLEMTINDVRNRQEPWSFNEVEIEEILIPLRHHNETLRLSFQTLSLLLSANTNIDEISVQNEILSLNAQIQDYIDKTGTKHQQSESESEDDSLTADTIKSAESEAPDPLLRDRINSWMTGEEDNSDPDPIGEEDNKQDNAHGTGTSNAAVVQTRSENEDQNKNSAPENEIEMSMMQILRENGYDAQSPESKASALLRAAATDNLAIAAFLLEHETSPEVRGYDESTPLMLASFWDHVKVARYLLENGAKVDEQKSDGKTALMIASERGNISAVQLLIEFQADIEACDNSGMRPLMYASCQGREEVVKELLSHVAVIDAQDINGATALMHASFWGQDQVVTLLWTFNAEIEARDNNGMTPLMYACSDGRESTAKILIEKKADITTKDNEGKSALDYAGQFGHSHLVDLLRDFSLPEGGGLWGYLDSAETS